MIKNNYLFTFTRFYGPTVKLCSICGLISEFFGLKSFGNIRSVTGESNT